MKKLLLSFLTLTAFTNIKSQDVCTGLESFYTFNNTMANQYNADPFSGLVNIVGGMYQLTANTGTCNAIIGGLPLGNNQRTIAMRVQASGNSSGAPTIFKYGSNASGQLFGAYYTVSTGTLTFQGFGTGNDINIPNFNVVQGTWFNLVMTYNGSSVSVYVNGVLKTQTLLALNTGTAIPFTIGGNGTIYHDNLRIYSRALSAADVTQLNTDMDFDCNSAGADICSGLITSYSFDRTNSNSINTEAFSGGVTYNNAVAGECANFTTLTANITNLPVGGSVRTISCWYKRPSSSGSASIFSYGTNSTASMFGAYVNLANGALSFQGFGAGQDKIINNTSLLANTWYHLSFVYTGTHVRVYVDGTLKEQFTRNLTTGTSSFTLGTSGVNGSIDDLKIYDRALSSIDVYNLYTKPQNVCNIATAGVCQNIRTTYPFNNTSANQDNAENFLEITGTPITYTTGIANNAMISAAGSSYTTNIASLPIGNSARTIAMWVKNTGGTAAYNIFNYGGTGNGSRFGMYFNAASGVMTFQGSGLAVDQDISNYAITPNTWTHIAVVYTGTFVQVYANGVIKESFQRTLTTGSNLPFTLGGFNGAIDDLRIYNRALSDNDVADIYAAPETTCTIVPSLMPTASVNGTVCAGATINFTASITGTATPTYSWSGPNTFTSNIQNPSITNASAIHVGTYTLTINNGGNIETATTQVNSVVNLSITAVSTQTNILCVGETATLTANGASTYTWNPGGNGTTIVVSPTVTSTYSVTGVDVNGCEANTVLTQSVSICTSINNISSNQNLMLQIYPNPANDVITINYDGLNETNSSIEITNTVGKIIMIQDVANETLKNINVSNLSNGIYFVQLKQNGKSIATKKLVINK